MQDHLAGSPSRHAVLAGEEVARRKAVLARLQEVLTVHGLESVLVGRHILALGGTTAARTPGPGDPALHVLGDGRRQVITTDGRAYHFADASTHPADDPGGAARRVLFADIRNDWHGPQLPAAAGQGAARPDGTVIGAGERALRRLRDEGVI
jgi:hypothetical protein